MKTLGDRVKEHRLALGLNATDYAEKVGTSRQNIENLEAGDVDHPRYIARLAKFMGVTVDDLLGDRAAFLAKAAENAADHLAFLDAHREEIDRVERNRHGLASLARSVEVLGNVERAIALAALSEWVKQGCPADQILRLGHLLQGASNDRPVDGIPPQVADFIKSNESQPLAQSAPAADVPAATSAPRSGRGKSAATDPPRPPQARR